MATFVDRVYSSSPIWIQQMMVSLWGVWWYTRRYGAQFKKLLPEIKERDSWTADQFRDYQTRKLNELLLIAQQSPYYRGVFTQVGVNTNLKHIEELNQFPYLTKETLRTRGRELLTRNPVPKGTIILKSSGTTGTPTEIFYPPEFHGLELAIPAVRNLGWAGVSYKSRRVMFGVRKVCRFDQSKPPFWRFSPLENMAYASIYHLSPRYLPHYIKFLRSYQPTIVMGYPSALATVAHYALEHGQKLFPAKVVVTTAETISSKDREVMEEAWQCQLFDRYGAVEGCVYVSQCQYGRYHVSPDIGIVEILDKDGRPTLPGQMGDIICTGLQNTLQPLIRYRIGDMARWAIDQNCPCGHKMPILEGIEGRYEDICYTPDGREMLRFDTVFKGVDNICEAQVVQEKIDLFRIKVIPSKGFTDHDIEKIKSNMRFHVGDIYTEVEIVEDIPRSPSGKFRAVICKLPAQEKRMISKACVKEV